MQIACDGQSSWPANAFQDRELNVAEFRRAHPEVDQAESGVAIAGIEFGQKSGRVRVQSEQLDDRQRVALLAARGGGAVVQQLGALFVGDEWFHGRCAQVATINGRWFCANVLMRQSVTVKMRFCAKSPKRIPPNPWMHESANA